RLGLLSRDAVARLQLADQLIAAAFDLQQIIVRELAPLLLDRSLGLVPAALDLLPDRVGIGLAGLRLDRRMDDHRHGYGNGCTCGKHADGTHWESPVLWPGANGRR